MKFTAKAYAKVNLSIAVTGITENGYHTIESVMQSVDLYDIVTVEPNDTGIINVSCGKIKSEDNICHKAARLVLEKANLKKGVDIIIKKNIPLSAGLGGGSADAAAVILLLNKTLKNPLPENVINEIAPSCGADVPFCLYGGTMRAEGLGEKLNPIKNNLNYTLLLIKQGIKPSTAEMYRRVDAINGDYSNAADISPTVKSVEKGNYAEFTKTLYNSFSPLYEHSELYGDLIESGADGVCLSGSGPTVFGVFSDITKAKNASKILTAKYGKVYIASPKLLGVE